MTAGITLAVSSALWGWSMFSLASSSPLFADAASASAGRLVAAFTETGDFLLFILGELLGCCFLSFCLSNFEVTMVREPSTFEDSTNSLTSSFSFSSLSTFGRSSSSYVKTCTTSPDPLSIILTVTIR